MYDKVIKNTLVCDGTGAAPVHGEVAIDGDRIAAIGNDLGPAHSTFDAQGLILSPGFIDIHTHYDAQITWDPTTTPSPQMGVTTIVMGNCGFGIAPCRKEGRDDMLRMLTKVEGMPLEALNQGVQWHFETFGEYLQAIENSGTVANVACFASHGCLRMWVMGEAASQRAASPDELQEMQRLFAQALDDGALGLGTSTLESHNGQGGVPVPSRFADVEEFEAFSDVMKEKGKGVWQITKGVTPDMQALESIAKRAGRPMQVCPMLQDPGQPEVVFNDMRDISAAQSRGVEMYGQVSPFPEILQFNMREPYPMESIKAWHPAMAAQSDHEKIAVYENPEFRAAVKAELKTRGGAFRFSNQWSTMTIIESQETQLIGKTLAEIAEQNDCHPLDCMLDIGIQGKLETLFRCVLFNADEAEVTKLLNDPSSSLGLGDSGAHLTFFCQAGTGLYLLQRYVREIATVKLEDAVRLLTRDAAHALRIPDRGQIAPGMKADLVVFDPQTAGIGERCWVADLPGGLQRIHTPPQGIHAVWINGRQVVDESGLLGDAPRAGQVIRDYLS